jgi:LuxR family maltose regulon positive regulatory protein
MLDYLDRSNLFLTPLDVGRQWYRYHHLFADLLRSQLQKSLGEKDVAGLHLRASEWHEQNGLTLEAIHHASMAIDDERVERLIAEHYMELVNRDEMSSVRFWMGKLSKELVYRRPWLCLYEALSRSWFGHLEEANMLLSEAEKHIQSELLAPGAHSMLGYHAYIKSRVTAMQGETRQAIEFCLTAREKIPADNLALQNEVSITLGYEYFLYGDFESANQCLYETIRSGYIARAVNNPVAAYALLARMQVYQGQLHKAYHLLQMAAQLIQEADGQYLGATGLVEVGIAVLLCEWNELDAALERVKKGLDFLHFWGKTDDFCLAYITLWRIQLALGNRMEAEGAMEKAAQLMQTRGLFSEARRAVEAAQLKMWLAQGDWLSVERWATMHAKRLDSQDPFRYEDELFHITQTRVLITKKKLDEANHILSYLEESVLGGGRQGRLIEIMILKALAKQAMGETMKAHTALTNSLALAEPGGYVRIFLDEGQPLRTLIARWLAEASTSPLRNYAIHLFSQFDVELNMFAAAQEKVSTTIDPLANSVQALVEPLSRRELEVLRIIALGKTNKEIAQQLVIAPGTVKAHTASIYRKLNAANRTEAVARARQLDILD